MQITVNGNRVEVADDATIIDVLRALKLAPDQKGIAVAQNLEVVPRSRWAETRVDEGDELEVVTAAQGG